jgi:hypothetical protein
MPGPIKKRFTRTKDLNYITDNAPAVKGSMNANKTPIEVLTNRINVLVKTCNRMTLQMQKFYAQTEEEKEIADQFLARDSRDVSNVTSEIVKDEEAVAREAASQAAEMAQEEAIEEIAEMRRVADEEIARAKKFAAEEVESGRILAARESKLAADGIAARERIAQKEEFVFAQQRKAFTNEALAIKATKEMALAELKAIEAERTAVSRERASIDDQRNAWEKAVETSAIQAMEANAAFQTTGRKFRTWKIVTPILALITFGVGDLVDLIDYLAFLF